MVTNKSACGTKDESVEDSERDRQTDRQTSRQAGRQRRGSVVGKDVSASAYV